MDVISTSTPGDRAAVETECKEYSRLIEYAWTVPGLTSAFIPQGICRLPGNNSIAISLHDQKYHEPSKLVIQEFGTGVVKKVFTLFDDEGKEYRGHAGGAAVHAGSLWICSGGRALRFSLPDLEQPSGSLLAAGSFQADSRCSYMSSDGSHLWLGEFRHPTFGYKTGKRPPCPADKTKYARAAGYIIDPVTNLPAGDVYTWNGKQVHAPARVIFTPDRVQGMALSHETAFISVSFGPGNSLLSLFKNPLLDKPFEVKLPAGTCAGYVLGDTNFIRTIEMPAGSQDLDWDGNHLLTVFEGGHDKYRRRWRGKGGVIEDRVVVLGVV